MRFYIQILLIIWFAHPLHSMHRAGRIARRTAMAMQVRRLGSQCPFPALRLQYYQRLCAKPWGVVSARCLADLHEQYQRCHQQLLAQIKTSQQTIISAQKSALLPAGYKTNSNNQPIGNNIKIDEPLWSTIITLLQEHSINPTFINIIRRDALRSFMSAGYNTLYLNVPTIFAHLSQPQQESILRHEIQHFLHRDAVTGRTLERLLMKCAVYNDDERKKFKDLLIAFNQICEKRADILAALSSPQDAFALAQTFDSSQPYNRLTSESCNYPTNADRFVYLMQLYYEMKKYTTRL